MSYIEDNESNNNELDPFSNEENVFESKEIRHSKSHKSKRRANNPSKQEDKTKKKPSLHQRVKTFFKELPEREDKKIVYTLMVAATTMIIVLVLAAYFSLTSLINNRNHNLEIEETEAYIESTDTDVFWGDLNEEDYKLEIEDKYSSTNDPDLKFLYRKELINFYFEDEEKQDEAIELINEQLSYSKITTPEKVNLLVSLIELYKANGMTKETKKAVNELLKIPDDGEMTFGGETFAELKARLKNENS